MATIWLLPNTQYVRFGEIANLIALALYPDARRPGASEIERFKHFAAMENLAPELQQAVDSGALQPKDPLTHGPHSFPIGQALKDALIAVDNLRTYVADRSIEVKERIVEQLRSNAPRPIEAVNGRSYSPPPVSQTPVVQLTIDWTLWRNMHTVKLWQACALVIGLEPDQLKHNHGTVGQNDGPVFDDKCFPNPAVREKFDKALRLAENAVTVANGLIAPQGTSHPRNERYRDVLLSQVVAFFVSCNWTDIPEQLHCLAQAAASAGQLAPSETKEQRQDRRLAACEAAGIKMPKSELSRLPDGVGKAANSEGVTRQAFSADVKAALKRKVEVNRQGGTMHRA